jgi:dimeric dUTPase (all-alpha-NTP-PPase superfamily)
LDNAIIPQTVEGVALDRFEPSGDMLRDILTLQDRLNSRVSASQHDFLRMTPEDRALWIIRLHDAAEDEFAEVRRHICFKWWKKNQTENLLEAQKEWVDRFHFVLSEGLALGINADFLYTEYLRKNQINHDRQDNGY